MPGNRTFGTLLILFLILCIGCTQQDAGKMPITTKSDQAKTHFLKGRDLFEKLRDQESLEHFQKAIELDPDFGLAYFYFAQAQPSAKGFFEQLDKALLCVDKISPAERNLILGLQANAHGDPMSQREYYQKNIYDYPKDERMLTLLANNYYYQQEYQTAIELFNKAVKINPDFSPAYNQLGYANRYIEKFDAAESAFKKYIQLIPDDPNPYDSYAELLMKMGRYEESISQYEEALKIDPNFVASHIGIATNLNYLNKHAEAREQCQKLYDMARNDGEKREALYAMAVSFIDENDYQNAIKKIEERHTLAKKINDVLNEVSDLNLAGDIFFESGNFMAAKGRYELAIKTLEESNLSEQVKSNLIMEHLKNEALVAMKERDFETAHQKMDLYQQKAMENINPNQKRIYFGTIARIALEEQKCDDAMNFLTKSDLQNPYNLYRLAKCYKIKNDMMNAKKYCEKTVNFNALNDINYAFCRSKALTMMESL